MKFLLGLIFSTSLWAADYSCLVKAKFVMDGKDPEGYTLSTDKAPVAGNLYRFSKIHGGEEIELPLSGFSTVPSADGTFKSDIVQDVTIVPYCKEDMLFVEIGQYEYVFRKLK